MILTTLALAQRLERAEASASAAFVEARARLNPALGAEWRDVNGTYAMFDGVGSPITQTFALGLFSPVSSAHLEVLHQFFDERGAEAHHEVSPLADAAHLHVLHSAGCRPTELTSVMYQPLPQSNRPADTALHLSTRVASLADVQTFTDASIAGWSHVPELADFLRDIAMVSLHTNGRISFVAEMDGRCIATAGLSLHGDVALLTGASTVPAYRNRGAQRALLNARLAYAAEQGCTLAMMGAQPGSTSQLNAERAGFRIAYTRTKWSRT